MTTKTYPGPPMHALLATHSLAKEIISTHPHRPADILDDHELALLRAYVLNPDSGAELLKQQNMPDARELERRKKEGDSVQGSLVGYVIATGGFDEREIEELRMWFEEGGAGDLEGVEMSRGV